jgi:hypothetical protein
VEFSCTWRNDDAVTLRLPMEVRLSRWERGAAALERGPLVYALAIDEEWRRVGGSDPFADYELHPRSPWSYALALDESAPSREVRVIERSLAPQPWARCGASTWLEVPGRTLPDWRLENGSAAPVPQSPATATGAPERLLFVPYGCARLRVSVLPVVR